MNCLALVGGLSGPSKMPCPAWGLSARRCVTGSKLRLIPGTACEICYAYSGNYSRPAVKRAHARRLLKLRRALADPAGYGARYLTAWVRLLYRLPEFRWFDSGDLQSYAHLVLIAEIASRTPYTKHWLPTQERAFVLRYLRDHAGAFPPNLTVRLSAVMVGTPNPPVPGTVRSMILPAGQPAPRGTHHCPAHHHGYQCNHPTDPTLDCRACWDPAVDLVSYTES